MKLFSDYMNALGTLVVLSSVLSLPGVQSETYQGDIDALLAFKKAVRDDGYILSGWSEYSDPCDDQWRGISCTCYSFFEVSGSADRPQTCLSLDPAYTWQGLRVLQINLEDVRITDWNILSGNLPEALGNLTALRVLNLAGNMFSGPIPEQWQTLQKLEILSLSHNNISGRLPVFFKDFYDLKYVYLNNNSFEGPIPSEWCDSEWWMFDVADNKGLCDEVPWCIEDRLVTFAGTSLVDVVSDQDRGNGGYCDVSPPSCDLGQSACQVKVPDPPFWTSSTKVTFSFPDFPSKEGGTTTKYKWKLCVPSGVCVTDWIPYQGKDMTQSAEVIDTVTNAPTVISQLVHVVDSALPTGVSLTPGVNYVVQILGYNAAGIFKGIVQESSNVSVDFSPPYLPLGKAVYTGEYFNNIAAQLSSNGMGISWDEFQDPESGITTYYYQIFEYLRNQDSGTYVGPAQTQLIETKSIDDRSAYISKLPLSSGKSYFVRVTARNGAGLQGSADSAPINILVPGEGIVVETTTKGVKVSNLVIVLAVVGSVFVLIFLAILLILRKRYKNRQKANKKRKGQLRALRHLMSKMSERVGDQDNSSHTDLHDLKHVAFVITDLENSTGIAAAAPRAYEWAQEAHDTLMRDLIAAYGAYEINTEGDAFHVAFKEVSTAVNFCMEIQYEMMEIEWPKEVLKLSGCEPVYSKSGQHLVHKGPRIRMGIHWAEEGYMKQQLHSLTKHRVFSGTAFQITRDLCESAKGGQVLLTHEAWILLRKEMKSAGFPVVEQLGAYIFQSWSKPIWVYQVRSLIGRPLQRPILPAAGNLKDAKLQCKGAGLAIVPAPVPQTARGDLAFLTIRVAKEGLSGILVTSEVPNALYYLLLDTIYSCAMQYEGYTFQVSKQGYYILAFSSIVNAVRMSHTIQMVMMSVDWPSEFQEWCGKEEISADGKLLFKGPRLAIGIHKSCDYSIRPVPLVKPSPEDANSLADYLGPAEEISRAIADAAHGGQVVLSEAAWAAVQDQLPGGPTVISLGTHIMKQPCFTGPAMLMEVMPQQLNKRTFLRPRNSSMVEPGYRDSPSENSEVTIAHLRVSKPAIIAEAEKERNKEPTNEIEKKLHSYYTGVALASKTIRSTLRDFGGYECKEPQPGKFTLAFSELESALRWAAAVQVALLNLDWPAEILHWPECSVAYDVEQTSEHGSDGELDGPPPIISSYDWQQSKLHSLIMEENHPTLLWRGLAVRIGMASGTPLAKAPLNTGRADYYGTIPNLAARLVGLAQPGQILFDAARLETLHSMQWIGERAFLPGKTNYKLTSQPTEGLELAPIGQLKIKGLDDLRSVFQASAVSLQRREFSENPAMMKSLVSTNIAKRIASLRRASDVSTGQHPALSDKSFSSNKSGKTSGVFSSNSRKESLSSSLKKLPQSILLRKFSRDSGQSDNPITVLSATQPDGQQPVLSYSDTSSMAYQVSKALISHHARKTSESSLATTPKSYMSHDRAYDLMSRSPEKKRFCKNYSSGDVLAETNDESQPRPQGNGYGSLEDMNVWGGSSLVRTPSAMAKVVDHWDASLAMEEALKSDALIQPQDMSNSFLSKVAEDDGTHSPSHSSMTTETQRFYRQRKSRMWQTRSVSADYRQEETTASNSEKSKDCEVISSQKTMSRLLWIPFRRKIADTANVGDSKNFRIF